MTLGIGLRAMLAAAGVGGDTGPWDVIDSTTLGSAAASISFASIDSKYKLFRVTALLIKDASSSSARITLNNDTGSNYDYQRLHGGTTVTAGRATGWAAFSSSPLDANGQMILEAVIAKQVAGSAAMLVESESRNGTITVRRYAGRWNNTDALINRIDLSSSSGNFAAGTVVVLEGLAD